MEHVVVVGFGLAGLRAAEALRREGFTGRLTIVSAESGEPYDRPPLSKQFLAGTWDLDRIRLRIDDGARAEVLADVRAHQLDLERRCVVLHTGQELAFDGLVIATGSQPRTFPGADGMDRVHVLRTLDQSVAIKDAFATARTVAVVGGGFIGSEVASTAKDLGLDVTVVEALPLPLVRVLGEEMGQVFADLHRRHGVELRLGVGVTAIDNGRILMADGTSVEADVVVVGIGVTPATEWLDGSGLTLDNGVVCDATCAAEGAEGVVAAGDVCRWFNPLFEQHMRVEHWTNAAEQAEAAAATLVRGPDRAEPFAPVPYFWSDQYDVKVQMVGIPGPEVHVVEGSADDGRFVAAYGREGRIVGALAFSQPRLLMKYRAQIADRGPFPPPTP